MPKKQLIKVYKPSAKVIKNSAVKDWKKVMESARRNTVKFWEESAKELKWYKPWGKAFEDKSAPFYKWFIGGKCNIVANALDRWMGTRTEKKPAIVWESDNGESKTLAYGELNRDVCRLANGMKKLGVKKGDRVAVYMQNIPEAAVAMLACAKIGAVHCVIYAGFAPEALHEWFHITSPKMLVTEDVGYRSGKVLDMKKNVDEALKNKTSVKKVIFVCRTKNVKLKKGRDYSYDEILKKSSDKCETVQMDSEDPLFILYNSGTASNPRGMVHVHGGYMVGVNKTTHWSLDMKPEDTIWSTADPGWITGHSYTIYGPLMAGATTVMFEGVPVYPKPDRIWKMIDKYKVNILYTAPTLLRMLKGQGDEWVKKHSLKSLRLLGSVGERIDPATWKWYYRVVGHNRCPIMDTWWQTETGAHAITPLPAMPLKPGSAGMPFPGIVAEIVDESGKTVKRGEKGFLVLSKPWPSLFRNVYKKPEEYKKIYFSTFGKRYCTLDMAMEDKDGYFWMLGRSDDVIKIAGHRIGASEIESAAHHHPAVQEVAVIGKPHKIKGECAKAFVVLRRGFVPSDELVIEIKKEIVKHLGPIAITDEVEFIDKLPKNRNGKIMRRVLKAKELGEKLEGVTVF